jgi:hypothetical protein
MTEDLMRYGELVEAALRSVVRDSLRRAEAEGLPGEHHFYITCRTDHPGVEMPTSLRASYPEEITLVLEHQFWDLEVSEESFSVTLGFGGKNERLLVPFESVIGFVDPSVEFGLQFKLGLDDGELQDDDPHDAESDTEEADIPMESGTVVKLDTFRNK